MSEAASWRNVLSVLTESYLSALPSCSAVVACWGLATSNGQHMAGADAEWVFA